jgi:hypothetical protein
LLLLFDLTVFYFIYGSLEPFSVALTVASNDGLISEKLIGKYVTYSPTIRQKGLGKNMTKLKQQVSLLAAQ